MNIARSLPSDKLRWAREDGLTREAFWRSSTGRMWRQGQRKDRDDCKVTMEEHFGPCLRSMRSYIAERALRWLGHVARMPSDKLPRRMLSAWVYQAKGSSARKRVAKQTAYSGTVAWYHFKLVPSVQPDVRGGRAQEHQDWKEDLVRHAEGGQVLRATRTGSTSRSTGTSGGSSW
jgi:hypothetical protein